MKHSGMYADDLLMFMFRQHLARNADWRRIYFKLTLELTTLHASHVALPT